MCDNQLKFVNENKISYDIIISKLVTYIRMYKLLFKYNVKAFYSGGLRD